MQRKNKAFRCVSVLLSVLMLFSSVSVNTLPVFAASDTDAIDVMVEQETDAISVETDDGNDSSDIDISVDDISITDENESVSSDVEEDETIVVQEDQEDDVISVDVAETDWASVFVPSDAGTEEAANVDFSSCRLIIAADNESAIIDAEHVIGNYDGLYLLQYDSEALTKMAFAYYYGRVEFVAADIPVQTAADTDDIDVSVEADTSDEISVAAEKETDVPVASLLQDDPVSVDSEDITIEADTSVDEFDMTQDVMSEDANPVAQLEDAVENMDVISEVKSENIIALIDTGVPESTNVIERVSMIGDDVDDNNGHGTQMLGVITSQCDDAKVISVKAMDSNGRGSVSSVYAAIQYAMERNVNIIALPLYGYSTADNEALVQIIQSAVAQGIIVVGAAGNDGRNVKYYIPGKIEEALIVGACDENGEKISSSNYGATVDYNILASSTSEATAKMAAYIAEHMIDGIIEYKADGLIFDTDYTTTVLPVGDDIVVDGSMDYVEIDGHRVYLSFTGLNGSINFEGKHVGDTIDVNLDEAFMDKWNANGYEVPEDVSDILIYTHGEGASEDWEDVGLVSDSNSISFSFVMPDHDILLDVYHVDYPSDLMVASVGSIKIKGAKITENKGAGKSVPSWAGSGSTAYKEAEVTYITKDKAAGEVEHTNTFQVFCLQSSMGAPPLGAKTYVDLETYKDADGHDFIWLAKALYVFSRPPVEGDDEDDEDIGMWGSTITLKNGDTFNAKKWMADASLNGYGVCKSKANVYAMQHFCVSYIYWKCLGGNANGWHWWPGTSSNTLSKDGSNFIIALANYIKKFDIPEFNLVYSGELKSSSDLYNQYAEVNSVTYDKNTGYATSGTWTYDSYAENALMFDNLDPDVFAFVNAKTGKVIKPNDYDEVKIPGGTSFYIRANTKSENYRDYTDEPVEFVASTTFFGSGFAVGLYTGSKLGAATNGQDVGCAALALEYPLISVPWPEVGTDLKLKKSWNDPIGLTSGNKCYDLSTTVIKLYETEAKAKAKGSDALGTYKFDKNGNSSNVVENLDEGTYWIIETTPGTGADTSQAPISAPMKITVSRDKADDDGVQTFEVKNIPGGDPLKMSIQKRDSITGKTVSIGGGSFANAVFKVSYWDNTSDSTSGSAKFTWYFVTDANGAMNTLNSALASDKTSSSLFMDGKNRVFPYGTYTLEEVTAPVGYLAPSGVLVRCVVDNKGNKVTYTSDDVYNKNTVLNKVVDDVTAQVDEPHVRGGVKIGKWDYERDESVPQGDATLEGAVFAIINNNDFSVTKPNGDTVEKDAEVMRITSGGAPDYIATTGNKDLEPGNYLIKEVQAPVGYKNTGVVERAFTIGTTKADDGKIIDMTGEPIKNNITPGNASIQKLDADAKLRINADGKDVGEGNGVPYAEGDKSLKDAVYRLWNRSANAIMYNGVLYAKDAVIGDFKTDATGKLLIENLPYGTYDIQEVTPSEGYRLDTTVHKLVLRETKTYEFTSYEPDIKGGVTIEKIDFMRNDNIDHANGDLSGAKFAIINGSESSAVNYGGQVVSSVVTKNITSDSAATYSALRGLIGNSPVIGNSYVMDIITTDAEGHATSHATSTGAKGLPYGTYYMIEIGAPVGYDLNTTWVGKVVVREHDVVYSYSDAKHPYYTIHGAETVISGNGDTGLYIPDLIRTGGTEVTKIDRMLGNSNAHADTDLSGAQFTIVNASKAPAVNWKHETIDTTGLSGENVKYADVAKYAGQSKYVMDVITTDKNGHAVSHTHADNHCDKMCKNSKGLPYGVYYMIETKPATYYDLNTIWVAMITVDKDGNSSFKVIADGPANTVKQQIWTSKVEIEKIDFMRNDNVDHADTNLEGAEFTIINASKSPAMNYQDTVVATVAAKGITDDNKATYSALSGLIGTPVAGKNYVMDVITTNREGYAVSHTHKDADCSSEWKDELSLPAGTYYIIETKAPVGYHLNTEWVAKVVVRKDGAVYSFKDNATDKISVVHGVEKAIDNNGDTKLRTPDLIVTGGVVLDKVDYMRDSINAHGDADLSNAEFTIINASKTVAVNWQHKTIDTTGLSGTDVTYADVAKYASNDKYVMDKVLTNKNGHAVSHTHADNHCDKMCKDCEGLPYGTYYVIETKAPAGYFCNTDWVGMIVVREEGTTFTIIQNTEYHRTINHDMTGITKEHTTWGTLGIAGGSKVIDEKGVRDQIYRSGISLNKIDIEMKDATTQGMTEFEGAEFTIINASKAVIRNYEDRDIPTAIDLIKGMPTWSDLAKIAYGDSIGNEKHEASQYVAQVIHTDSNGFAATGRHDLPYGTYYIIETKAPYGYFVDDNFVGKIVVREDNAKLQLGTTTKDGSSFVDVNDTTSKFANTVDEQIRRGDLAYQKVDEDGIVKVHVPFLLSAVRINDDGTETILESHVVVTDEQGYIWTGRNKHSVNTNMLDNCLVGNSKFEASASALSKAGVSTEAELLAYAADNMGTWFQGNSMTYPKDAINDTYGALYQCYYRLTELQCESNRDLEENLVNSPRLWVTNDTVNYLTPMKALNSDFVNRFESLKSNYMAANADTKEPTYVRWQNYVTTVSADVGNIELWSWTTRLVDKQIVAESEALDVESKTHTVPVRDSVSVTDTVKYGHLDSDHKYKLATQFVDLTTGKTLRILSTNAENEELTKDQTWVTKEFQPTAKRSTIITYTGEEDDLTMHVNLDTRGLEGHTIMAVDYLYEYMDITVADEVNGDWVLVKIHPADGEYPDSQKLYVPDVHSYAVDTWTGDRTGAKRSDDAVIENLEYMNLSAGEDYIFVTDIVNSETGESLLTKPVEYTFHYNVNEMSTPISDSLQMPVMEFDSSAFKDGMTATVITSLYRESRGEKIGEPIVTHTNLADEDETIRWIDVYTTASDKQTKDDVGTDESVATVYDTVKLDNVIFDLDDNDGSYTYDLKGTLVFQKDFTDKNGVAHKQGDAVDTLDGTKNEVRLSVTKDGKVTFTYADGSKAEGKVIEMKYGSNVAKYVDTSRVGDNAYIRDEKAIICDLTVEMIFKVDSTALAGGSVVVFEDLYHDSLGTDTVLVADHKDITDEGQTVHYPDIATSAIDSQTKDDVGALIEHEKVIDTVTLDNLIPGRNYVVNGTLMDQMTGEQIRVNGKLITQSANVHVNEDGTIISGNGEKIVVKNFDEKFHEVDATIDLTFEFDARSLQGRTVVVFEDLVHNGITVASHADIKDESQTVHYPEIHTSAADGYTKDNVGTVVYEKGLVIDDNGTKADVCMVVDHVSYSNLVKGKTYTVMGTLMDQKTGKAYKDGSNNEVIVSRTFVAGSVEDGLTADIDTEHNSVSGIVDLVYEFDGSNIEGTTLVVFEDIYHNDVYLTSHADIKDEAQTVHFPKLRTSAINVATGDEVGSASEMKIKDIVSFWNLPFDKDYVVRGVLVDKQTGEILKDADGNAITAENPFHVNEDGTVDNCCEIPCNCKGGTCTCEDWAICVEDIDKENGDSDGHVHIVFNVDASDLAGHDIVVYEYLYHNDIVVARHTDINDLNQTIHIPDIRTSAVDIKTGDNASTVEETAIVNDYVYYENLVVGREYTIKGILMNQATNAPVLNEDGTLVRAEATFKAVEASDDPVNVVEEYNEADNSVSGYYVITFNLNSTALKGKTVVAFEDLYHNGVKLVSHAEILDKAQSVHYPDIHTNAVDETTGDHVGNILGSLINGVKHLLGAEDADGNGIADDVQQNIVDTVSLNNLIPGYTYVVSGKLYNVEASMNSDAPVALTIDGKEITQAVTITVAANGRSITANNGAKTTVTDFDMQKYTVSGTVDLTYTLDSSKIQDTKIVVFEDLYHDVTYTAETDPMTVKSEDIIDTHRDIHDEDQSVSDVGIKTTAVDSVTGSHVGAVPSEENPYTVIKDEVNVTKLIPSVEYTVKGVLVDINASDFAGGKVVYLKADGTMTEARSEAYEEQIGFKAVETEEIHYLNFALSSDYVQGKAVTVFEELYHNGIMISAHPANSDPGEWDSNAFKNQTVYYPTGKTNATDNSLGTHTSFAGNDRVITDRVYFEDLLADEVYTITGRMMYESDFTDADGNVHVNGSAVDMDAVSVRFKVSADMTEADYLDADGDMTGAKAAMDTVTATTLENGQVVVSGYVALEFHVDASKLAGASIVAFEDFENRGVKVFTHADLNDLPETVKIPKIHTNAHTGGLDEAAIYDENGNFRDVEIVDTVTYENVWTPAELLEMKEQGKAVRYLDGTYRTETSDIYDIDETLTYVMKGVLMDVSTGKALMNKDGEAYITYSEPFTPVTADGSVDVRFIVNAGDFVKDGVDVSDLDGKTVVAFETMYQADSVDAIEETMIVAEHADMNDAAQDIRFPKARTHASDGLDTSYEFEGNMLALDQSLLDDHNDHKTTTSHEVFADGNVEIVDYVSVENLHGNTEYTVTGNLMVVVDTDENGYTIYEPAKDDDDNVITSTVTFNTGALNSDVNASVSGYVPVVFTFSGVNLAGKTTVTFETVRREGSIIAVHADIQDAPQMVYMPKIETEAFDAMSGQKVVMADGTTVILDKVSYENLEYGKIYTLDAQMHDKTNGEAVGAVSTGAFVAGVDNQIITTDGTKAMTVEAFAKAHGNTDGVENVAEVNGGDMTNRVNGEVYIAVPVDTSDLAGHTLVAFERLNVADDEGHGKTIAVHEDIDDDDQTVYVPKISTHAAFKDGTKQAGAAVYMTMVDKVTYENLVPGVEYTAYAELYNKETGEPIGFSGKTVFTPETSSGSVDVEVEFDGHELAGKHVVAFETLTVDGYGTAHVIAEHKDINDDDQTIDILVPAIGTQALYKNETKKAGADAHMTVVDTVKFENLTPGVEYILYGQMMNKETGEAVSEIASKKFTPDVVSGYTTIEIPFDGSRLGDTNVVAFETLKALDREDQEYIVAEHKDLNDEAQMVDVLQPEIATTAKFKDDMKQAGAAVNMIVYDTVAYVNLTPGTEYVIEAQLFDRDQPVDDGYKAVSDIVEMPITVDETEGSFIVEIPFDGSQLGGHHIVTFETLKAKDSNGQDYVVADHKDINDENQTVEVLQPEIRTIAKFTNGEKSASAFVDMTVVDTVIYENLTPGVEYTLEGQMMDKATTEAVSDIATMTFVAESANGETTIEIPFDGSKLGGHSVVAFETLKAKDVNNGDYIVAEHKDIDDADQTVDILQPVIRTIAKFADGTKSAVAAKDMTVTDTVVYENLMPGVEYTLEGQMMDKADGKAVSEIAVTTFRPEKANGETTIEIPFDGSELGGHSVVAFETLKAKGSDDKVYVVAEHKDLADKDQTVDIETPAVPEIRTVATFADGSKSAEASNKMTVIDTVTYKDLTSGVEYTLVGELMYKDGGKTTGITGTVKFTPDKADGTATVTFTFDGTEMVGKQLVAFETLTMVGEDDKAVTVAEHKDINDESQTVTVTKPSTDRPTPDVDTSDNNVMPYMMLGLAMSLLLIGIYMMLKKRRA